MRREVWVCGDRSAVNMYYQGLGDLDGAEKPEALLKVPRAGQAGRRGKRTVSHAFFLLRLQVHPLFATVP